MLASEVRRDYYSFPRSSVGMPSSTLCVLFASGGECRGRRRGASKTAFPRGAWERGWRRPAVVVISEEHRRSRQYLFMGIPPIIQYRLAPPPLRGFLGLEPGPFPVKELRPAPGRGQSRGPLQVLADREPELDE